MGLYEIMLIVHPEIEENEQEEVLNGLTATINKQGGNVSTVLDWRKRKLAYEINKLREGQYYLVYFSGEGTIIPELEHYFRVTDAIMRYMIISVDEKDFEVAAEKAAAEAAVEAAEEVVEETPAEDLEVTEEETAAEDVKVTAEETGDEIEEQPETAAVEDVGVDEEAAEGQDDESEETAADAEEKSPADEQQPAEEAEKTD